MAVNDPRGACRAVVVIQSRLRGGQPFFGFRSALPGIQSRLRGGQPTPGPPVDVALIQSRLRGGQRGSGPSLQWQARPGQEPAGIGLLR